MAPSIPRLLALAALTRPELAAITRALSTRQRGRPWSRSLRQRMLIACVALRTNLTIREIAACMGLARSTAHRIITAITPQLAQLATTPRVRHDRRESWIVDGTLIPTRDHACAARSKNYRWSCNAQILVRRRDLRVVATHAGGPGNRNDTIHYRSSRIEHLCREHGRVLADGGYRGVAELVTPTFRGRRILRDRRWRRHRHRRARVEHAIARLKTWRVLRDHRRRGRHLAETLHAITYLHNLRLDMRDKS